MIESSQIQNVVDLVRTDYPGWNDFSDAEFVRLERSYKLDASARMQALLGRGQLQELIDTGQYDEVITRLKHLASKTNLLYLGVPRSGDMGILYQDDLDKAGFCTALFDLLYGDGSSHERLDRYVEFIRSSGLKSKWTFPTYFLFLCYPETEMFVKPDTTRGFLSMIGRSDLWKGVPSGATYAGILQVAQELKAALAPYQPRDMVDIQSFIWVAVQAQKRRAAKMGEFDNSFATFVKTYLVSTEGQAHQASYDRVRREATVNLNAILAASATDKDATDTILLKFLPYADSATNRERGAWVHFAPSINQELKTWFQNQGWTDPDDWPRVAQAILHFVRRCTAHPEELADACTEFASLPYAKGFQSGMLTPILNALKPEEFRLVNNKVLAMLNHFEGTDYGREIADYPAVNTALKSMQRRVEGRMALPDLSISHADVLDMFAHWLWAIARITHPNPGTLLREGLPTSQVPEGGDERGIIVDVPDSVPQPDPLDPPFVEPACPFNRNTFALLAGLSANPTSSFYQENKAAFVEDVEQPFQRLLTSVPKALPVAITDLMETEKKLFSRILKNDHGQGGAWDYYWGAFYPKGGKRIEDAQLSLWINRERLEIGFYIGNYGNGPRERFRANARRLVSPLVKLLGTLASSTHIIYGSHHDYTIHPDGSVVANVQTTFEAWLNNPETFDFSAVVVLPRDQVLAQSEDQLQQKIADTYKLLFPLVLLAVSEDPLPAINRYLGVEEEPVVNPPYSLADCAAETGFLEPEMQQWVEAIQRKRHAIIYGPPGTGKTFMARKLAQHLAASSDGLVDLVQFHPAYAYEDFIQGIRPQAREDGSLDYPLLPGRFLQFCAAARLRKGNCVLIIDEINRANLARVFGELMYLLEYRDQDIPLAGGSRFRIPENVYIIGTMNTADRSIALVDHALRRRFAFLALYPNYDLLCCYHERLQTGFPVDKLVAVLKRLNKRIGNSHYEVGISYFMREDLAQSLQAIWSMEVVPYLEEYFFDQPQHVEDFRWNKIAADLQP